MAKKWLIRSIYLAFLAALGGGGLVLYTWMRPEFIRAELVSQLTEKFNNVDVEVGDAHLRVLGGISVTDLKLIRRDDPTRTPFLHVPSALLHYDKEQLNDGKLVIRKVEFYQPKLRIERGTDGKWNLADLLKPATDEEPAPLFILHEASIDFFDRRFGEQPMASLKDINATIVNDPSPVITFQARGNGRPIGSFVVEGKYDRRTGFGGTLDLSNVAVGSDLMRLIDAYAADCCEYVKPLTGQATAHLEFVWQSGSTPTFYHDLRVELTRGRYAHPDVPVVFDDLEVSLRSKNGDITIPKATARVGQGTISATLDLAKEPLCAPKPERLKLPTTGVDQSLAPDQPSFQNFEDRLRSLEVAVANFAVTPELLQNLPAKATMIRDMFKPSGSLGLSYTFLRDEVGWTKKLVIAPGGMEATYRGFPYRMRNIRGTVVHTASEGASDHLKIDLQGDGAGTTATIKGTIAGTHPDVDVDLTIVGKSVTLDEELIAAMPDDNPTLLRKLRATAFGDFTATIRHNERLRREYGPEMYDNTFDINLKKGSMNYDVFPYALENMTGRLVVRTVPERPTRLPIASGQPPLPNADSTSLEFHDFRATHNGARITGSGRKDPAPGGSIMNLRVDAESLALDEDLRRAFAAIKMESAWKAFEPSGRINCAARVKLYSKNDPRIEINPAEDLEMGLAFAGGVIKPNFLPYVMHDLAGRVAYAKGRVEMRDFRAKHGKTVLTLPTSEVLFRPSGGYWADLRDLHVEPLIVDKSFLAALPPGLRSACEGLDLRGPMSLHATRMVIDDQPGPYVPHRLPGTVRGAPDEIASPTATNTAAVPVFPSPNLPTIYWDGRINLAGASVNAGVDWENIHGTFASWGLYKGDRLGAVRANVVFDRATVAKQPMQDITASLKVDPRQPDVLSIPAIRGKLFGGDIGGEAWVVLEGPVRYAVQLNAARVRLSEVGKHYKLPEKSHIEGLASAQLYLANRPDERTGKMVLQGGGAIDVPNGKLLNLPVFLNLMKVVKLRVPDETGFEEAHALFHIHGDRVRFGQLDLIGNAISLGGSGEMKIDGTDVQFEFYPVWTKMKEMFALPGEWTGAISKRFLKIRVSGQLDGKLEYRAEPVPGLVDPVKRIFKMVK